MSTTKHRSKREDQTPAPETAPGPAEAPVSAAGSAPAPLAVRIAIVAVVLGVSAVFLFARLGHYALWDDESATALTALNLWRVGDTSLVLGKNIVAPRDGSVMTNMRERSYQPLMFCLAAPSLGLLGQNAWAARLPFALCGLACVALMLRWAWREELGTAAWILLALALLGNVSFFLYSRQCRYYAPTMLLPVAIAYVYRFHDGSRRSVATLGLLSLVLLATSLFTYLCLYATLTVDYAIWGRKRHRLSVDDGLWLFGPQLVLGMPVIAIFNPWNSQIFDQPRDNWFAARGILFYRTIRDMNRCEFGVLPLIVLAPLLYVRTGWQWLLRAPLALLVAITVVTVISPQPVVLSPTADVRYVAWAIPLSIACGALVVGALACRDILLALILGAVAFGTNVLNLDFLSGRELRSTVHAYINELVHPPGDPYTMTAAWLNQHVEPGRSVCVIPLYMIHPLMFHAPGPVYAWQLPPGSEGRFPGLDPIHFRGRVPPDYFIAFGPAVQSLRDLTRPDAPVRYEPAMLLDFFWRDMFRPELMWRTFKPITRYDRNQEAIYIFRKAG